MTSTHDAGDVSVMDESMASSSSSHPSPRLGGEEASTTVVAEASTSKRGPSHRVFLASTTGNLSVLDVPVSLEVQTPVPVMKSAKASGDATAGAVAAIEAPPTCRNVVIVDAEGQVLRDRTYADSSSIGSAAVQRIAEGWVGSKEGVESRWVIALARKNASIDVVCPLRQPRKAGKEALHDADVEESRVELVASYVEPRMKAGIERWTGLAIGSEGVYACTSSGFFSFTPLVFSGTSWSLGEIKQLSLPAPLQHVAFWPLSHPTHFAYGGEEIPLSVWEIEVALSPPVQTESVTHGALSETNGATAESASQGSAVEGEGQMNAKARKRKRQAESKSAARELMWGEVWRAKNLPNDALSLPQRANITSICFLPNSSSSPNALPSLLTGTRDGHLRLYDPTSPSRRHVRQTRPFPPSAGNGGADVSQTAIKVLVQHKDAVYVGTAAGRLGVLERESGVLAGSFKEIRAAVTGVLPLPLVDLEEEEETEDSMLLLSTTLDHLVRLHSATKPVPAAGTGGALTSKMRTRWESFVGLGNVVGAVWDGGEVEKERSEDALEKGDDEEEDGEEGVWEGMRAVGDERKKVRGGTVTSEEEEEGEEEGGGDGDHGRDFRAKKSRR